MNTKENISTKLNGWILVGDGSREEVELSLLEEIKTDDESSVWSVYFVAADLLKVGRKVFFATNRNISDPTHGRTTHKKRKLKAEILSVIDGI